MFVSLSDGVIMKCVAFYPPPHTQDEDFSFVLRYWICCAAVLVNGLLFTTIVSFSPTPRFSILTPPLPFLHLLHPRSSVQAIPSPTDVPIFNATSLEKRAGDDLEQFWPLERRPARLEHLPLSAPCAVGLGDRQRALYCFFFYRSGVGDELSQFTSSRS